MYVLCYIILLNVCLGCCIIFWMKDVKFGYVEIEMGCYYEGLVSIGVKLLGNSIFFVVSSRIYLDILIVLE